MFSFTDFLQTPACHYTLVYEYKFWIKNIDSGVYSILSLQNNSALPSFIAVIADKTFKVESKDFKDVGNYKSEVWGSVPAGKPAFSDVLSIYLNITALC